jgi:hypothetical protein
MGNIHSTAFPRCGVAVMPRLVEFYIRAGDTGSAVPYTGVGFVLIRGLFGQ